jgi:hypothetical protein
MYYSLYPNPAHGVVNISYALPEVSDVTFEILNTTGQPVGKDYLLKAKNSGNHQFSIAISDLSSGIYYCRMITNKTSQTKKLVVLR